MVSGAVWTFDDNINTDLILPGDMLFATEEEQRRAVFRANRPGLDRPGPQGRYHRRRLEFRHGIEPAGRAIAAQCRCRVPCSPNSINGLFFRNAVNFGLIALEVPGVRAAFAEGQTAIDLARRFHGPQSRVQHRPASQRRPPMLLDLMLGGGLYPHLERKGLLEPRPGAP